MALTPLSTLLNFQKRINKSKKSPDFKFILIIVLIFLISRVIFFAIRVRFNAEPLKYFWQYIDPQLLKNNLWESLFFLHTQPPLFNLYLGIVQNLFGQSAPLIFHISYFLCGLIITVSLFLIMSKFNIPKWLGLSLITIFIFSPSSILYENFLFYPYPVTMMLCASALALYKFLKTKKLIFGTAFFLLLAIICLTRSLFHILWFASIAGVLIFYRRKHWKKIIISSAFPFLLILSLYVKDYFLFGQFTTSSWLGMNLSRISTFRWTGEERMQWAKKGKLSLFATIEPYNGLDIYRDIINQYFLHNDLGPRYSHVSVLNQEFKSTGDVNFNHILYIDISRKYLDDALHVICSRPDVYLSSIYESFKLFLYPSHDSHFLESNRRKITLIEKAYSQFFYGQFIHQIKQGIFIILVTISVFIFSLVTFLKSLNSKIPKTHSAVVLTFLCINIIYITLFSNLLEFGENNRFRMLINPFILIIFVYMLKQIFKKKKLVFLSRFLKKRHFGLEKSSQT